MTNAVNRRGACPALTAPMQTGDGLLVRLHPSSEGLGPGQLIGLCASAERHGNGIVEITARGNFQIRGLTACRAKPLADEMNRLGIEARSGVPVDISPLAGIDPTEIADPRPLASAIREGIGSAGLSRRLGPKVSVVIDGGGAMNLHGLAADIRLSAMGEGQWRLALAGTAGTARPIGEFDAGSASTRTIETLGAIARLGLDARARDLPEVQRSATPPSEHGVAERCRYGLVPLTDSRVALVIYLPYGSAPASDLADLIREAEAIGVSNFRLAPGRRLLALCPDAGNANRLVQSAARLGFIVDQDDPRLAVSACAGAPACASAHFDTRNAAKAIAEMVPDLLAELHLHISGCAKGCAHPAPAALTLVGGPKGVGLVVNGTARGIPMAYAQPRILRERLVRLGRLAAKEQRSGETLAATLTRVEADRLAGAFEQD